MSGPLNIRNLTAVPFTVKVVERFEVDSQPSQSVRPPPSSTEAAPAEQSLKGLFNLVKKNVTEAVQNVTATVEGEPTILRGAIGDGAPSFAREDVDIRVDPFTTNKTSINAKDRGHDNEVLRLELEGDGGRWSLEVPSPTTKTQVLKHLGGEQHHQYTVVFVERCTLVAILDSTTPESWMGRLKDDTLLSALSIPGTHNSPTYHRALPSVRCQVVSPREQLENGVRFFDIRMQISDADNPQNDQLQLVHGNFPIALNGTKEFRPLLDDVIDFLTKHPSETVVMSLKREGSNKGTDQQLSLLLHDRYVAGHEDRWYTAPRVPRLSEVRGKIVLLRRFKLDDSLAKASDAHGWGLDGENWAYNTEDCPCGALRVQDFCEVDDGDPAKNVNKKIDVCCQHFERAAAADVAAADAPLFLNFLSASNFWKTDCWPDKIAARLNPATTAFLCERHACDGPGHGAVGVVVCDWVGDRGDWDLVRCILAMNTRLILAQQG